MDNDRPAFDLGAIEKAVNDASSRAAALWLSFITFGVYVCVAVGSVTHRMLFLETPIKLPVFNVELPLVGFFVIAPLLFATFHFYVFVQLELVVAKAGAYNRTIAELFEASSDRALIRQRLDSFPVLQLLAGPGAESRTLVGYALRAIIGITLLAFPIALLLQIQLTFLSYHLEWVTWLHRALVVGTVVVSWMTWRSIWRRAPVGTAVAQNTVATVKARLPLLGAACLSALLSCFSLFIATYPGERLHENQLANIADSLFNIRGEALWTGLTEYLFQGPVDEVSGRPQSIFSNVLVLPGEKFVDEEKLDKIERSVSLRGRDLRGAVLVRADLRRADLSGANLNEANLFGARLQGAWLRCISPSKLAARQTRVIMFTQPERQPWPDGCTWLQGASLQEAELQGTSLDGARLEGASLLLAKLQGASLVGASLQGASLVAVEAQAASFTSSSLQGALLSGARLQGANFSAADIEAAHLGVSLITAGTSTCPTGCTSLTFPKVSVWRLGGSPNPIALTTFDMINATARPFENDEVYPNWKRSVLDSIPGEYDRAIADEALSVLDPTREDTSDATSATGWKSVERQSPHGDQYEQALAVFLSDLVCAQAGAPFVLRGLVRSELLGATGDHLDVVVKRIGDVSKCVGAASLNAKDRLHLAALARAVKEEKEKDPEGRLFSRLRRSAPRSLPDSSDTASD